MKQILLIGDLEKAKYHPVKGFDAELRAILTDYYVHQTTDYDQFMETNLRQYDLCLCLTDQWNKLTDDQTMGILSFVSHGGGLLMIHQGISLQARPELLQLAGGKFIGHPEQCVITYRKTTKPHPIMRGVDAFSAKEEPYQTVVDPAAEVSVFMEYLLEDKSCAAGWSRTYGLGKVVYLSPGHNLETLFIPSYRQIIRQSCRWLVNDLSL